ncbi:trpE operon leader peptide TrpLE [Mycoplana rhizolycopersici]|nr:trpE operon leader peptide TrpLE [Rhizobium rhizolycopersici]
MKNARNISIWWWAR